MRDSRVLRGVQLRLSSVVFFLGLWYTLFNRWLMFFNSKHELELRLPLLLLLEERRSVVPRILIR